MNNIEFKALVKALYLSQRQVQEIGGYKDARQIRRFYAGDQPPHSDVVETLKQLDTKIDSIVDKSVAEALETKVGYVNVIGYTDKQYSKYVKNGFLFSELHLCLIFRLFKSFKKINIKCNVILFNYERFTDFIKENSIEDNSTSRSKWADFEYFKSAKEYEQI